jgi:uncharacterized membrane protein (Fun14 family)
MELERWFAIIASAIIIGYALPYITKFVQFIVGFPFRKESLEGTWHAYHFTRMHNETFLRYEKWTIKRNLLNRLIIETEDPKNPDLKYKGVISAERNYLLILLKGVKHKEEVQMRFFDIIPTGQDIAFGLAMGVDFANKPQCLIRIMSRKKLIDEEAREILQSKTMIKEPGIISISE